MSGIKLPERLEVVERWGLRFGILCEYYTVFHTGELLWKVVTRTDGPCKFTGASTKIIPRSFEYKNARISKPEINAAECYLVKSGFLEGGMAADIDGKSLCINGISTKGIDLVERAIIESRDRELSEGIAEKNGKKIWRSVKKLFRHPATESTWKIVNAIVTLLQAS